MDDEIIIGKYYIAPFEDEPDKVWIGRVADGEGEVFDASLLEAVIEAFYKEHF